MSKGYMTLEQAERAVWAFYWQLDHSRDRRVAPLVLDPPDAADDRRIQEEKQIGLWNKIQRQVNRWFGAGKRSDFERQAVTEAAAQLESESHRPGRLDPATGLPVSAADLASGRAVVTGMDLCMGAIVPPDDLAASVTTWLPPCPLDESPSSWGSKLEHWQAMAYKPRETPCEKCRGQGVVLEKVTHTVQRGIFKIARDEAAVRQVRCGPCGGHGTVQNWTDEEVETVKRNTHMIKRAVHELASKGYFDKRPINPNDTEMHDLVWQDDGGFTIGFRLTWEGYQYMKQYCVKDDELRLALGEVQQHVLTLAGEDVRRQAPEWARNEFKNAQPIATIESSGGGFSGMSGGGFASAGGFNV